VTVVVVAAVVVSGSAVYTYKPPDIDQQKYTLYKLLLIVTEAP